MIAASRPGAKAVVIGGGLWGWRPRLAWPRAGQK